MLCYRAGLSETVHALQAVAHCVFTSSRVEGLHLHGQALIIKAFPGSTQPLRYHSTVPSGC